MLLNRSISLQLFSVPILVQRVVRVVEVSDYYVINKFQLKFALNINVIILIEYLALSCKDIYIRIVTAFLLIVSDTPFQVANL